MQIWRKRGGGGKNRFYVEHVIVRLILQGGEPDISTVAKMILNDWQRAKIPYFVKPPGSEVSLPFLENSKSIGVML